MKYRIFYVAPEPPLEPETREPSGRFILAVLFGLLLVGLIATRADARDEAPPVILDLPRTKTPAPVVTDPRDRAPVDGPMCAPELFIPGDGATHLGVLTEEPASEDERLLVAEQIGECRRSVGASADPFMVLALLRLERDLGVPEEARGILGAVWCIEGAMRLESPRDRGPIRGDLAAGIYRARGPLQGHGWLWKWCALDERGADDLLVAATCYWSRVADRMELPRACNDWRVAEALTANGPRYLPAGCRAESGHWRELRRWRS